MHDQFTSANAGTTNDTLEQAQVFITRVFDAPPDFVFKAWTEKEHLLRWYAPNGCSIKFSSFDFRPGGSFVSCIKTPGHHDCWCKTVILEMLEPVRLVYSMTVVDEQGNEVTPASVGMDADWPAETIVTVLFDAFENKTRLTLRQNVAEVLAKRTGAHPSWLQMLDTLNELLRTTKQ